MLDFRRKLRRAKAIVDFERHEDDELGFRKHDIITVSHVFPCHFDVSTVYSD